MSLNKKQYDNYVWGLKHRPETIDDIILPKRYKKMFNNMVQTKDIGNILLNGPRGSGKTTVAFCLSDQTGLDTLYINMSNETGIDTIRTKLVNFVSTVSFTDGKKIIIGDECDRLSVAAMDSLKGEIEKFTKNCNFIFITNHKGKLTPEFTSRLNEINFIFTKDEQVDIKKQFYKRLQTILTSENVEFDNKAIGKLINMNYPDLRKTINTCQMLSKQNDNLITMEQVKTSSIIKSDITKFYKYIADKDFSEIRIFISNMAVEHNSFYSIMFQTLESSSIIPKSLPQAILIISKYQYEASFVVDTQIPLTACCIELMSECEW